MSTGRDGTIIVVQTQGVTSEDDKKNIALLCKEGASTLFPLQTKFTEARKKRGLQKFLVFLHFSVGLEIFYLRQFFSALQIVK
jgi:hypothetical protein